MKIRPVEVTWGKNNSSSQVERYAVFQTELELALNRYVSFYFWLKQNINFKWFSFGEVHRASIQLVGFTTSH